MEFSINEIPEWLITTVIGVVGFVVIWLNRQRLGLGEVQMATRAEQQKVIELQERRIELLEAEVGSLRRQVDYLTSENESLHRLLVADKVSKNDG
jgi:hypothetical protein